MTRATELISFHKDKCVDPRMALCYARGSVFKPEGNFFRVEKGQRTVVHRSLCVLKHFGKRCTVCPNLEFTVKFVSGGVCD